MGVVETAVGVSAEMKGKAPRIECPVHGSTEHGTSEGTSEMVERQQSSGPAKPLERTMAAIDKGRKL